MEVFLKLGVPPVHPTCFLGFLIWRNPPFHVFWTPPHMNLVPIKIMGFIRMVDLLFLGQNFHHLWNYRGITIHETRLGSGVWGPQGMWRRDLVLANLQISVARFALFRMSKRRLEMDPNGTFSIGKMMIQRKTRVFLLFSEKATWFCLVQEYFINFYYIIIFGDSWIDLVWPTYWWSLGLRESRKWWRLYHWL